MRDASVTDLGPLCESCRSPLGPGDPRRRYCSQRCPECNLFCRSLGPGGQCPCCCEPVAISDLIEMAS